MKRFNIKVTSTQFGKSDGTIHTLNMSEESAKKYCEKMNTTECYSKWAKYEMIEAI